MKPDIKAADRGEQIRVMEPLLLAENSRHRAELTDVVIELAQKSAAFHRSLPPSIILNPALAPAKNCHRPVAATSPTFAAKMSFPAKQGAPSR